MFFFLAQIQEGTPSLTSLFAPQNWGPQALSRVTAGGSRMLAVPLPLLLHRIPCHHIPNCPLLSLTLQVSRSLLLILPTPPPPTRSPLHSPLSLILRYRYLTPLLVVAPLDGTRIPFFQHSYPKAIPLGYNKLVLHL